MARKKARSFFKQCKDYVRGIQEQEKKITRETVRKRKVFFEEVFVDKPLKELKTEKRNSEENKLKEVFVENPLKELKRQDETKKCNSEEEFVDNELKNQETNLEG
ncbi:hypothetical protein RhiirC2_867347 [Rhizophagus irregularis]|uniref:Uncharacterized protein n=1 Tax=Rhizophagus irregularis TaxID=588596 RepID=A0A2N1N361_9GLOM|nr:hypothetical protein RhiirC2_867347 [Rhizophagus irregularis]